VGPRSSQGQEGLPLVKEDVVASREVKMARLASADSSFFFVLFVLFVV
jgi:hypothetical protein